MRGRPSWGAATAAALVVAEAGVLLLRPRRGLIRPLPVSASSYFSAAEIDRARAFRRPQRALALAATTVEGAALAGLAARPALLPRRPAPAGAVTAAALIAARLPLVALMRRRGRAAGLVTQSWRGWAGDLAKGTALASAFGAGGSAAAVALRRRRPRDWWAPAAALAVGAGTALTVLSPVLLDPLFNRFERLPDGELRAGVLELAGRAGVDVGEVFTVDASRRTTAANAYVTGLGATKRIVLFDTLEPEHVRLVVAHELAHVRHRDVARGLLYGALVAPAGAFAVARLAERLGPSVPALWLAAGLVAAPLGIAAGGLSRAVERRADAFALRLTGAAGAFVEFHRRVAVQNLAEPAPPRLLQLLLGTHPTTLERIGIARAYASSSSSSSR